MSNTYDIGDRVRLTFTFTSAGVLADPTTVTAKVRNPNGVVTTPSPAKDSTGTYHVDQTLDTAGRWVYRGVGTGAIVAAMEQDLIVRDSAFVSP